MNSPPPALMFRGGASASRLSLPAFPGDLFRNGCDHSPRSQTGYPRRSTGFIWLCCLEDIAFRQRFDFLPIQVSVEDAERLAEKSDGAIGFYLFEALENNEYKSIDGF